MDSRAFYSYDVFLSFRGDMRDKFTSHLYERLTGVGLSVFKDDEKLVEGEVIIEALKTAINSSRICMPIFSKNYASSKACLQELSHMLLECKNIIPIFYDVEVDDVKLKTNLYEKALKDHHQKGNVGKEEVDQWKMALIEVCKILGYNIVKKNEADEITKITREVLSRLMHKYQNLNDPFVEIDDQVESIIKMLDLNSNGCRIIGVCGMGGIGKTTLAKVVYNRISSNFNNCCTFVENVRESVQNNQLPKLQQQLYKDLIDPRFADSIDDINHGINMIRKGLENKKFLLVLDDVDKKDLLRNCVGDHTQLGNGSRIIITTRNKRVLKLLEQDLKVYEVQELDDDRALQLFSWHAFKIGSPLKKFESLSKKVVSSLGGLPLALEVVGSSLRGHDIKAWEETMERLKKAPYERIQRSLMISYHRLHKDELNIFFDIACYPGRMEKTQAFYMWESSGWHPNISLDNLINQSLVKVEVSHEVAWLWMHDVLKDFGRDIIRKEYEENGRILKRFLRVDGNFDKISNEERKYVEMLQIPMTHTVTISSMDLEGFENVRFIELERPLMEGNFEGLLPNLRWISIRNVQHFMAINFKPENLVVLQLFSPYLEIRDIQIEGNKLKVLDFSYCEYMKQTPSFKELPSLEMLVLDWCTDLIEIDNSIGELKKLICLSMRECRSLKYLPEDIGDAKALKEIVLVGNYQKFELPCSISNLENLSRLELIKLNMGGLPTSIGKLVSLSQLDLSYTHINKLPDAIGQLKELRELRVNHSKIRDFPTTIGRLTKLENLEAKGCQKFVGDIPNEISMLPCLRILDLRETPISKISKLPSSLRHLLINSIWLKGIVDVSKLRCLSKLELIGGGNGMIISQFDGLEYIEELCIRGLQVPSSLKLWNCKNLKSIVGFDGLESLIDFSIRGCSSIEDFSFFYNFRSLYSLELWNCRNLKRIDWFEGLVSLINLSIRDCPSLEDSSFLYNSSGLSSLELWNCRNLKRIDLFEGPHSVTKLSIRDCPSFEDSSILYNLRSLSSLELWDCKILKMIDWFEGPKFVTKLSIRDCPSFEDPSFLYNLRSLSSLELWNCRNLKRIDWFEGPHSLIELSIRDCPSFEDYSFLYNLRNLSSLELWNCRNLKRIDRFKQLESLSIRDCPSLKDFSFLSPCMRKLSSLELMDCKNLKGTLRIFGLRSLSVLTLENLGIYLLDLNPLNIKRLGSLRLFSSYNRTPHCVLAQLTLHDCPNLVRIEGLTRLESVEEVSITKCRLLELSPSDLFKLSYSQSMRIEDVRSFSTTKDKKNIIVRICCTMALKAAHAIASTR